MRLTPNFTLDELTASQTAARKGIDNAPPPEVLANLRETARQMEEVRALLGGRPIHVSSGYRSPRLNRTIGGSRTSAHMSGWAVDFTCRGFGSPLEVCREIADSRLVFDQLINELNSWVHISFHPAMRRQFLVFDGRGYRLAR